MTDTGVSDSSWLHRFKVPERFSTSTTEAIEKGVISKGVRIEIVAAVAMQIMQYTMTPTSKVKRDAKKTQIF